MRRVHAIAIGALTLALLASASVAWASHVGGVYDRKDDAYRALAIRTDTNKRKIEQQHQRALKTAVDDAIAATKKHDVRVLRRAVRKMKSKARRMVNVAYKKGKDQGYASGQSAGYASGKNDGYSEGNSDGFDQAFTFCYVDDGYFC
jgi:flagellar biosynthesis/type III secretory pathway protein FliH